jgi:hypothetical protein
MVELQGDEPCAPLSLLVVVVGLEEIGILQASHLLSLG